jgi:hypothetical protein
MDSLPPLAAAGTPEGLTARVDQEPDPSDDQPHAAATTTNGGGTRSSAAWEPRLPPIRPSSAPVELVLDLRGTPPDKVLSRLMGALEQVGDEVTLVALLRDTPEFVGVAASAFQALRQRGYWSDTSRFPAGVQRLRIARRRDRRGPPREGTGQDQPAYVPAPAAALGHEDEGS